MKILGKEFNDNLFKKELENNDKITIAREIIKINLAIHGTLNFVKDYGAYKTRSKYRLSEMEYLEKINKIILDTQTFIAKLIIAEKVISINGLNTVYNNTSTQIFNLINSLMKKATETKKSKNLTKEEKKNGDKIHNNKTVQSTGKQLQQE